MKAVLLSVRPTYCEKIASGKKTIEVRKSRPKQETPFKVYIYQTKKPVSVMISGTGKHISEYDKTYCYNEKSGKVIGEFICDKIDSYVGRDDNKDYWDLSVDEWEELKKKSCLTIPQILEYTGDCCRCYGWHISELKIYDKPKRLSEFYAKCNIPESKCKLCDNCYDRADYYGRHYAVKKLERPPQSWCYVED